MGLEPMIESGWVIPYEDGFMVLGAEKHFDWIKQRVEAGRNGGLKRAENVKRSLTPATNSPDKTKRDVAIAYPLALAPSPALAIKTNTQTANVIDEKPQESISNNPDQEMPPAVCADLGANARMSSTIHPPILPPDPFVFPDGASDIRRVIQEWGKTLKHYGRDRDPKTDEVQLHRVMKAHGDARTINAIRGFRVEEKRPGYDPAKYVSVGRLLAIDKFLALEALGESIRAKKPEIDWSKIGKGES